MGREVRRVPADWQHPRREDGSYQPMCERSYEAEVAEWVEGRAMWLKGLRESYDPPPASKWEPIAEEYCGLTWTDWHGGYPDERYYMPSWPEAERTHFQMYESTTEGTPISPVFATPEELARWLVDNEASAFGNETATYEQWLAVCKGGYAPSMVIENGVSKSGVEFAGEHAAKTES